MGNNERNAMTYPEQSRTNTEFVVILYFANPWRMVNHNDTPDLTLYISLELALRSLELVIRNLGLLRDPPCSATFQDSGTGFVFGPGRTSGRGL